MTTTPYEKADGNMSVPTRQEVEAARPRSRFKNIALWVVQVVAALGFLLAALGKFSGDPQIVATFDAIGLGDWFRYLVGALEVAGSGALFIPRLAGVAGLAFVGLMVGAVVTELALAGPVALPLALLVLSAVVAWGRWRSAARLWAGVRGRRERAELSSQRRR